tara:strand:- start:1069 stop:1191 length:123 start_codon:yes stop_codon:yes gene_type:complete
MLNHKKNIRVADLPKKEIGKIGVFKHNRKRAKKVSQPNLR